MESGLLFCILAMVCFGALGSVSKLAERSNCDSSLLVVFLFGWATLATGLRTILAGLAFSMPLRAIAVAVICGICASVAYLAFQSSIAYGNVASGWLVMNVSAGIPALASIVIFHEAVSLIKLVALILAAIAVFFVFIGRKALEQKRLVSAKGRSWITLMIIVLLTNGMSAFGLKVIAAWGLPGSMKFGYLTVWYAVGTIAVAIPVLVKRGHTWRTKEIAWGSVMALLSIGGQVSTAISLGKGVPGYVAFPVAMGGSLLVVTIVGRFWFQERMSLSEAGGIFIGAAAIVLLSIG